MEKERIKEGLRALYPKVADELIEAAATYPTDSMVGKFIARIIARAASYGHAKGIVWDMCPVGHELNRSMPGLFGFLGIGDVKKPKGASFRKIEAITFDEWRKRTDALNALKRLNREIDKLEGWMEPDGTKVEWHREPWISHMFGMDFGDIQMREDLAGWNAFESKDEEIARKMHSINDPRLHGKERDIWIVREKRRTDKPVGGRYGLEVWAGRYTECNGVHYTEGPHRHGDWIGWIEKEDYERPKGEGDGR